MTSAVWVKVTMPSSRLTATSTFGASREPEETDMLSKSYSSTISLVSLSRVAVQSVFTFFWTKALAGLWLRLRSRNPSRRMTLRTRVTFPLPPYPAMRRSRFSRFAGSL